MQQVIGSCDKILHIVRLRKMLRRWRRKAASSSSSSSGCRIRVPSDVPAGHVAICVGRECRRFIVRASYLNHPVFKALFLEAEEEYGFSNHGPLAIPCDESAFEEVLRLVSSSEASHSPRLRLRRLTMRDDIQRCCRVESLPLLHCLAEKSVC